MGQKQTEHEYLYWEFKHPAKGFYQAVRMGKWKVVRYGINSSIELYDLEQDRSEKQDRAKENPNLIERAKTILHSARNEPAFDEWKMNPTNLKK
jgi:arylsulfatase A-like enzyme